MITDETIRRLISETTAIETIDLEQVINAYTKLVEIATETAKSMVHAYITYNTCSNNYRKLHGVPMRRRRKNAV